MHKGYASIGAAAPYFFLSYAHSSHTGPQKQHADPQKQHTDLDCWVGELFGDLCRHVQQISGLPRGVNPGFMDGERQAAGSWPIEAARALATCRVFVPLYSSSYFADERCGQEWAYFARRGRNRAGREPASVEAIVPGVWDPVEPYRLPPVAHSVRLSYGGGSAYKDLGLYGIIKLSRFRRDYAGAVHDLADRIVTAAKRFPVAEGPVVDFDELGSAFGPADRVHPGGKWLRITVVAPRQDELPEGRESSPFYGPSALDWSPYATGLASAPPIAASAAGVARDLGFRAEVGDLDQHEADLLSGDLSPGPQILIIDPWALLVPHSQHLLQRLDARHAPWVQAVIPWGVETAAARTRRPSSEWHSMPHSATSWPRSRRPPCLPRRACRISGRLNRRCASSSGPHRSGTSARLTLFPQSAGSSSGRASSYQGRLPARAAWQPGKRVSHHPQAHRSGRWAPRRTRQGW